MINTENRQAEPKDKLRGFFTVATGDEKYYKFAHNLLLSYRLHNSKYPFAILCDRENEYTKDFDQVVILNNVKKNFQDKFRLLVDLPYQEGVFIEPDCLIYKDISCIFDLLDNSSDLTSFGWNDSDLTPWFDDSKKIIEHYGDTIQKVPLFCPGYFFVRKTEVTRKIYRDIIELSDWIMQNTIKENPRLLSGNTLRDDPLFFIAMKLNGCVCPVKPRVGKCINYTRVKKLITISMLRGKLDVLQEREYDDCNLLHFSTRRCVEEGLYWHQCVCLRMCVNGTWHFLIRVFETKFFIFILEFFKKVKYSLIHRLFRKS